VEAGVVADHDHAIPRESEVHLESADADGQGSGKADQGVLGSEAAGPAMAFQVEERAILGTRQCLTTRMRKTRS
jgi:hypothetical protein